MKLGDPHVVGELMRARRKQLGFTIEQMAQATGLSPITIMRIELGRVGYIHAKTAKALEVPKKLTKRMVMENVAVTQDGVSVPLPPLNAMLRPVQPVVQHSGDVMAHGAPVPPALAKHKNHARRAKLGPKDGASHAPTIKKMLIWLANKI